MVIKDERDKGELTGALARAGSIMVLAPGPKATLVHDRAKNASSATPWRVCFLIENLGTLKDDEKKWFDADPPGKDPSGKDVSERYAVLGGRPGEKELAVKGPIDDLMLSDTEPDNLEISRAFAEGDKIAEGGKE